MDDSVNGRAGGCAVGHDERRSVENSGHPQREELLRCSGSGCVVEGREEMKVGSCHASLLVVIRVRPRRSCEVIPMSRCTSEGADNLLGYTIALKRFNSLLHASSRSYIVKCWGAGSPWNGKGRRRLCDRVVWRFSLADFV